MSVKYSPLRFLAALGNGGMVVTFFLYLNFLIPHTTTPIVDFHAWYGKLIHGSVAAKSFIPIALLGVIFFSVRHVYYLIDNLRLYKAQNYTHEEKSALGRERMIIPLTMAMTLNVGFIFGSLFVPHLWKVTEYLFPVAGLGFLIIGIVSFKIFVDCFTRKLQHGEQNVAFNNLSRLIPVFTFSMVSVGLAAPAAMSHIKLTAVLAALFSLFFFSVAFFLGMIQLSVGFSNMIKEGINKETSSTIWVVIPILTIQAITIVRITHFLEHHLDFHAVSAFYFVLISVCFSIQILFGLVGYVVMKNNGYFEDYIKGEFKSYGAYALICPGVAFFVLGMFLIQFALIKSGIVMKFSLAHIILLIVMALIQLKTIKTIFSLDRKLLK